MRKLFAFNLDDVRTMRLGTIIGALVSAGIWLTYIVVLREPGSAFYLFAALAFLGGPLFAGMVKVLKTRKNRLKAFFVSSSTVFGIALILFVVTYVVIPQYARTNVRLPAFCDGFDGSFNPPADLAYALPGRGTGILLVSDAESAVVGMIDGDHPPFAGSVFLVSKNDNKVLLGMGFNNDVISAAIDGGVVYIFNDKLGYLIDARTGEFQEHFLIIDNYGGLSQSDRPFISRASDGHWYMETTAVISSWNIDGTVKSRPDLTFNGIALGCFISGDTSDVTEL
jgi:hypothetical protein